MSEAPPCDERRVDRRVRWATLLAVIGAELVLQYLWVSGLFVIRSPSMDRLFP